jgi:hypothetical protein
MNSINVENHIQGGFAADHRCRDHVLAWDTILDTTRSAITPTCVVTSGCGSRHHDFQPATPNVIAGSFL